MKRTIISALLTLCLGAAAAPATHAQEVTNEPAPTVHITTKGKQVHITGAQGVTMEIYNLTGVNVATIQLEEPKTTLTLNLPKGCYILKVGKIVRKISIS